MMKRATGNRPGWRGFFGDEKGSFTIEALFWIPVFVAVLSVVADTAIVYAKQSEVMRVVQDANRFFAVGRFATGAATEDYIEAQVRSISPNVSATSELANGVITTTVTMPARDLTATGFIPLMRTMNIVIRLQQMKEV